MVLFRYDSSTMNSDEMAFTFSILGEVDDITRAKRCGVAVAHMHTPHRTARPLSVEAVLEPAKPRSRRMYPYQLDAARRGLERELPRLKVKS